MQRPEDRNSRSILETMQASLMALAFGLGILAFLIAIDRPQWFNLRPASGTAAALSNASDHRGAKADAVHHAQAPAQPGQAAQP